MILKKSKTIILAAILILIFAFGVFKYFQNYGKYQAVLADKEDISIEVKDLKDQITQLQDKLNTNTSSYEKEVNSLKQQLTEKEAELKSVPKLNDFYINQYKSRNLNDPTNNIIEDLKKRTDLIPQKAELGGTMRMENIELLSPDYAYATYTDGHILGYMILKFYISKEGKIDWQVISYTTF